MRRDKDFFKITPEKLKEFNRVMRRIELKTSLLALNVEQFGAEMKEKRERL